MQTVKLLGLTFDNLDVAGVVHTLLARSAAGRFVYVVTPNIDHIARLRRRPDLAMIYDKAWLRVLDSHLLRNAARLLGMAAPDVATGADVTTRLLRALAPQTIAVIGLEPRHLSALQSRFPQLDFVHHAPPMNLLNDKIAFALACEFAVAAKARFTFIALGSPLQELLAHAIAGQPGASGTGLCVGAALEFCAGARQRAPGWMQTAGLEWLHRLLHDPRRLARRYLVDDPPVLLALLAEALRLRWWLAGPKQIQPKT